MGINETIEFIKSFYPIQEIKWECDKSCIAMIRFSFSREKVSQSASILYKRIRVLIKNMDPMYVEISPEWVEVSLKEALEYIDINDISIEEMDLQALKDADVLRNLNRSDNGRDEILKKIMEYTGKSETEILKIAGLPC